ncbi:MAG: hypothetical protein J7L71_04135 [Spirochaetaceae bacterium]|nr:hypothetical protein [Spirochaetaceae bacterium]
MLQDRAVFVAIIVSACVSVPDFTTFNKSLGVIPPVVMFGEKTDGDQDSANFQFTKTKSIALQSDGTIVLGGKKFGISLFTADGEFIKNVGTIGEGEGEFEYPKGLAYDSVNRRIVLADEKNYRVQSWSLESLGF